MTWTDVCALDDLLPDRGAAALVGGEQVALFRLSGGPVLAIANGDPLGGANVLSRGLVGSRGDRTVVFSPLHKQAFDLVTGECLDAPGVWVVTYPVHVAAGRVLVGPPNAVGSAETAAATRLPRPAREVRPAGDTLAHLPD